MVLNGKQKNQTKKKLFTIVISMETEYGPEEIDRKQVAAESAREAIRLAYPRIFNQ